MKGQTQLFTFCSFHKQDKNENKEIQLPAPQEKSLPFRLREKGTDEVISRMLTAW